LYTAASIHRRFGCLGPQLFPGREDSTKIAGPDVPLQHPRGTHESRSGREFTVVPTSSDYASPVNLAGSAIPLVSIQTTSASDILRGLKNDGVLTIHPKPPIGDSPGIEPVSPSTLLLIF
jgi:hypothetical protein